MVQLFDQVLGIHLKNFKFFEFYNAKSPISNTGGGVRCKFITFPIAVTDPQDRRMVSIPIRLSNNIQSNTGGSANSLNTIIVSNAPVL